MDLLPACGSPAPEHRAKTCKRYWYKIVQAENVRTSPVGKMLICLKDFLSFLKNSLGWFVGRSWRCLSCPSCMGLAAPFRSSECQSWTSATGSNGAEWGIVLKWGKQSLIQHLWAAEERSLLSLIGFGSARRIPLELSFCATPTYTWSSFTADHPQNLLENASLELCC